MINVKICCRSTTKAKLLSCGDRISSLEDTKSNLERQCQCLNEELNISKTEHTKVCMLFMYYLTYICLLNMSFT